MIKDKKIAIIIVYFGKLKESFKYFLKSIEHNSNIDYFLFLDQDIKLENTNKNIFYHKILLKDLKLLIYKKLNIIFDFKPYKLCDFRPLFPIIFEDYVSSYDYVGYGDVDTLHGNLDSFLYPIIDKEYFKINWWGHLSFLKNDIKTIKKIEQKEKFILKINTETNIGFDEKEFNTLLIKNNFKIFTGKFSADIDCFYTKMKCVDKKTIIKKCKQTYKMDYYPKNYRKQIFVYNQFVGSINRLFKYRNTLYVEEFAYIHFRSEPKIFSISDNDLIVIGRNEWSSFALDYIEKNFCYILNRFNPSPTFKFYLKKSFKKLFK